MLLFNAGPVPDPQELSILCLPGAEGGLTRELRVAWLALPLAQVAGILAPCAAQVNLTFTDPVTGGRLTLPMALVSSQAQVASEEGAGTLYSRLSLTLREG